MEGRDAPFHRGENEERRMRVLIAEDDDLTRAGLAEILQEEGYDVVAAPNGEAALRLFAETRPDFVCLDIMMPGVDGYEVCRMIHAQAPRTPIIFISAKGEEIDKVLGLELGADDFIVKPFGVKEVVARIRAVTRRTLQARGEENANQAKGAFELGDLWVYPDELRARREEHAIELSLRDVKLLEIFYMNPGKVLSRDMLYRHAWGVDHVPNSRTVDQHISQLRKRVEVDPKAPTIIQTVHGAGYRYDEA